MGPVLPTMKAAAKGRLAGRPAVPAELHDDPSQILFLICKDYLPQRHVCSAQFMNIHKYARLPQIGMMFFCHCHFVHD
jgi:hypothetical protein